MKQISLYYSAKDNTYFHVGIIPCEACKTEMKEDFYLLEMDKKKEKHSITPLCPKCFQMNKGNLFAPIIQYKYVVVTLIMPQGAIPVIQHKPELADGNLSVYDVNEIKSVRTVDRTVHSSRQDWSGAKIGIMPEEGEKVDVDKHLSILRLSKPDVPKELTHNG